MPFCKRACKYPGNQDNADITPMKFRYKNTFWYLDIETFYKLFFQLWCWRKTGCDMQTWVYDIWQTEFSHVYRSRHVVSSIANVSFVAVDFFRWLYTTYQKYSMNRNFHGLIFVFPTPTFQNKKIYVKKVENWIYKMDLGFCKIRVWSIFHTKNIYGKNGFLEIVICCS